MRVLLTARHPVGGIRTFFRYVYGNPVFRAVDLEIVAPDDGLSDYLDQYVQHPSFSVRAVENTNRALLQGTREALKEGGFDLVHSHGFTAGLLTELAVIGLSLPHLMTAHDVFLPAQFHGWNGRLKHFLMARVFGRMSAIHTVTDEARRNFLEFFPNVRSDQIHGILHGVDTSFFADGSPVDHRALYGIDPDRPLIGFFGRFMAQKGFRDLVQAVSRIVENERIQPKPVVITFGWGGFIREDYQYLKERGLSDYFIQAPKTDDMPGAMKGVDAVAMPSKWEACGLLAMEALAAGVPIVGTDCVGLNEVLRGSPARIVKPASPDALSEALVDLLYESDRQSFRDYQAVARQRFDVGRAASELADLYRQIGSTRIKER